MADYSWIQQEINSMRQIPGASTGLYARSLGTILWLLARARKLATRSGSISSDSLWGRGPDLGGKLAYNVCQLVLCVDLNLIVSLR